MKNYIVKIENGKPVIYGDVGNEDDGTAPVYIFETEEAYDAAVAEGLVPVGSLVVKTYDAVEMAGGPFDPALSPESENAPQNKVVDAAVARLDQAIADAVALRASLTGFGMGKITPVDVTDITEADGRVLGGFEKNPAVAGSLANLLENLSGRLKLLTSTVLYFDQNTENPESYTLNHNFGFNGTGYFITAIPTSIQNDGVYIFRAVNVDGNNTTFYARRKDGGMPPSVWASVFAFG